MVRSYIGFGCGTSIEVSAVGAKRGAR